GGGGVPRVRMNTTASTTRRAIPAPVLFILKVYQRRRLFSRRQCYIVSADETRRDRQGAESHRAVFPGRRRRRLGLRLRSDRARSSERGPGRRRRRGPGAEGARESEG